MYLKDIAYCSIMKGNKSHIFPILKFHESLDLVNNIFILENMITEMLCLRWKNTVKEVSSLNFIPIY